MSKPSKPQMNLLRSLAGLEARQLRMKPVVYKTCVERGWITTEFASTPEHLTDAGREAAGI